MSREFALTCLPSLLTFVFAVKAWIGRGGGGAICESTSRDLGLHQRNQKSFRKERRSPKGPPDPRERPPPRGFAKRDAAPPPRRGLFEE